MSEAYWVGGLDSSFASGQVFSEEELKQHEVELVRFFEKRYEILPGNVGLFHWISSRKKAYAMQEVFRETGFFEGLAVMSWQQQPLLDHFVFHSAARDVMSGDHSLMGIGQETECAASTLLLASPRAVGFYNILPKARVAAQLVFQCQCDNLEELGESLNHALAVQGFPHEDISWMACTHWCQQEFASDTFHKTLPSAEIISIAGEKQPGAVFQINALVEKMESTKTDFSLLLSFSPGSPGLATIFERI